MNLYPTQIRLNSNMACLQLYWSDGRETQVDYQTLRRHCPCAGCQAQATRASEMAEPIQLLQLNPLGYGVQLVFSDGHQRGIYPWSYLAQL